MNLVRLIGDVNRIKGRKGIIFHNSFRNRFSDDKSGKNESKLDVIVMLVWYVSLINA